MRVGMFAALCLLASAPAAAQIVRVSVATDGTQANGPSGPPAISGTGRYLVFSSSASNLVAADTNGVADVFLRDRDTDADGTFDEPGAVATTRLSTGTGAVEADGPSTAPVITPDGRFVAFASAATNLMAGPTTAGQVYRLDRATGAIALISQAPNGLAGDGNSDSPAMSADGNVIAFRSFAPNLGADGSAQSMIVVRNVAAGTTERLTVPTPGVSPPLFARHRAPSISADGTRVAWMSDFMKHSQAAARNLTIGVDYAVTVFAEHVAITADGRHLMSRSRVFGDAARQVLESGDRAPDLRVDVVPIQQTVPAFSPSGRYILADGAVLGDFDLGVTHPLPFAPVAGAFSTDDRWLAVTSGTATLLPGGTDTNAADDVFVLDLPDVLDADGDTMDDRWETIFGVTDPDGDPDGDGRTNAEEEDAGTHPNGQMRRFLAEGATGTFFHTTINLANPHGNLAAAAVLTFDTGDGRRVRRPVSVPASRLLSVTVGAVSGLEGADVSTTVESDRYLGVERRVAWGRPGNLYGSHAESAVPSPATTWFLAEGSTVLDFDLFYLLHNPQPTTTQATVRFLLPSGATVTRTYDLGAGSRTTLYVNQVEGLGDTDVSGEITATAPIVVERAMYRSTPSQPFALGHGAMGVTAPATSWFLAEGATGSFFDLYVLVANPTSTDAQVEARFARPDGSIVTRRHTVRASSRFSIFVDAIPGLESTPVATTLTSTNGVPIVVERAMYWPGGFFDYYEGHASPGTTVSALNWLVGSGEGLLSGHPENAQTFVLIANVEDRAGEATLTVLPDARFVSSSSTQIAVPLPPTSRTTVPVGNLGAFAVIVTSTGPSPVQLVVEGAVYHNAGGIVWAAGSNARATPLP